MLPKPAGKETPIFCAFPDTKFRSFDRNAKSSILNDINLSAPIPAASKNTTDYKFRPVAKQENRRSIIVF